jgi:hypothetical protein
LRQLADKVGIGPTRIHELEAGLGASAPLALWFALGSALDRPFAGGFSRDVRAGVEPADAGHLAAQELVLRLALEHGRRGGFELSTRPGARDAGHVDIGLRDDPSRAFIMIEIWNRLDDMGRASRRTQEKVVEVSALAESRGYRVAWCWLLVDTAANRLLVRRYPAVLRTQFSGSSYAWARCLEEGAPPPRTPGLAWVDPRSRRIRPLRLGARL